MSASTTESTHGQLDPSNGTGGSLSITQEGFDISPVSPHDATFDLAPSDRPVMRQPRLRVVRGITLGTEYPLHEGDNVLGRPDGDNSVTVDLSEQETPNLARASRRHANIRFEGGSLLLEDLGSRNGTHVNGLRLVARAQRWLYERDIIQIGSVKLQVTG